MTRSPFSQLGCDKLFLIPLALTPLAASTAAHGAEAGLQEIVISASPHQRSVDQIAGNVTALSGDDLAAANRASLGATLAGQVGIGNSSFGPIAGQPVVRGQSGKRLAILNNAMASSDAAAASADHANAFDTLLLDRIEIIRGPATLRYGPGAIGGVINLIDNRIHTEPLSELEGAIDSRYASNGNLRGIAARLDGGDGSNTLHLDGAHRRSDDIDIPGRADPDDLDQPNGVLANSASEIDSAGFGYSRHGDHSLWGFSVNTINQEYGIPGEHSHLEEHEHDDHGDDHEEERGDEHVEITMRRTTLNGRWSYSPQGAVWQQLSADLQYSDYRHTEWGVIDQGREAEARFDIEQLDLRSEALYQISDANQGALGLQYGERRSEVAAEQPLTPQSTTRSGGLFWLGEWQLEPLRLELGGRLDWQNIDASGRPERDDDGLVNLSAALILNRPTDNSWLPRVAVRLDRSERAPTAEELYSDGFHAATNAVELGSDTLDSERALNGEVNLRWSLATGSQRRIELEATLYRNQFSRFTHLAAITNSDGWQHYSVDTESCSNNLADFDGLAELYEQAPRCYQYSQQGADFSGAELELAVPIGANHTLALQADRVRGKLDDGFAVPRLPADSALLRWTSSYDHWQWQVSGERVLAQHRAGRGEASSAGYTSWAASLSYQWQQFTFGLAVDNISDEEIRNASSVLREVAPESGRNVLFSVRYTID